MVHRVDQVQGRICQGARRPIEFLHQIHRTLDIGEQAATVFRSSCICDRSLGRYTNCALRRCVAWAETAQLDTGLKSHALSAEFE
jgi:hypothetical protein